MAGNRGDPNRLVQGQVNGRWNLSIWPVSGRPVKFARILLLWDSSLLMNAGHQAYQ